MGTKPMAPEHMQRRNRRLGDVIRAVVGCPLCRPSETEMEEHPVRVIAYRRNTARIECGICELRLSMRVDALNNAISANPSPG
jgi:transcription elongation factor Elf1